VNLYTIYIEDDRYSVPTIDILTAADDEQACVQASQRLATSPHYRSIAVWEENRFVRELPEPSASGDS
jgi:hypothetical protein